MTALLPSSAFARLRASTPVSIAAGFLLLTACAGAKGPRPADAVRQPSASEVALREQTTDQQVQHVLNRLAFGARPGDVQTVRTMGVDAWISRQLYPERINDASMDAFLGHFPTLSKTGEQLLAEYPAPGQVLAQLAAKQGISRDSARLQARQKGKVPVMQPTTGSTVVSAADSLKLRAAAQQSYRVVGELTTAKVARAVASERQLQEVMVDFWENHFNVFAGKDRTRYFLPEFEAQVIRPNALGKFRDLLGAVARSSAMLYYLDNWESVADSGRPTLAPQRRVAAAGGRRPPGALARRPGAMGGTQTIGELMDRGLLPAQQKQRLEQLPPERLAQIRKMTPPEAQQALAQFGQLAGARRPKGLNENYARELMELHTLGVDGGYTQTDVIEVARALTGWTIARGPNGGGFVFRPEVHDAGTKKILGVAFPAGRGIEDGEQVLDMLARSPATATFIATKLARRFVSDTPPTALVERAARTFTRTDGDLRETLRTIVTSPEFFSAAAYRAKVKSPFELVVSTLRAMNATADSTPRIVQFVNRLGEPLFGHQAPNGYPETGDQWMNTGAILNRINFGLAAATGRVPGIRLNQWPVTMELAPLAREAQVDGVIRALLGGAASNDTRQVLLTGTNPFLMSHPADTTNMVADSADSSMMNTGTMSADRRAKRADRAPLARQQQQVAREAVKPGSQGSLNQSIGPLPPLAGFAQIVGLALGAPEFQRR